MTNNFPIYIKTLCKDCFAIADFDCDHVEVALVDEDDEDPNAGERRHFQRMNAFLDDNPYHRG